MVETERNPWVAELVDLARAAAGGMLFGIPLLYTMEVWWVGSSTGPGQSIGVLAACFFIVLVLNRAGGFRESADFRWRDAAIDAVEAIAVGILCVTVVLVLLREVTMSTPLSEALGKIAYEATPFGIGVGLAQNFLRRDRADSGNGDDPDAVNDQGPLRATLTDLGATLVGAVFVGFNIAPTDEVPMIAAAMGPLWQAGLVVASVVISYWIVFESGFASQEQRRRQPGVLQRPMTETVAAYLVALMTAAVMLWFFQRFGQGEPWTGRLAQVVVLGLPASVGGAAGRLAA